MNLLFRNDLIPTSNTLVPQEPSQLVRNATQKPWIHVTARSTNNALHPLDRTVSNCYIIINHNDVIMHDKASRIADTPPDLFRL